MVTIQPSASRRAFKLDATTGCGSQVRTRPSFSARSETAPSGANSLSTLQRVGALAEGLEADAGGVDGSGERGGTPDPAAPPRSRATGRNDRVDVGKYCAYRRRGVWWASLNRGGAAC
jgi:hypothetical protein